MALIIEIAGWGCGNIKFGLGMSQWAGNHIRRWANFTLEYRQREGRWEDRKQNWRWKKYTGRHPSVESLKSESNSRPVQWYSFSRSAKWSRLSLDLFGDTVVFLDPKRKTLDIFHFLGISAVPSTMLSHFTTLFHWVTRWPCKRMNHCPHFPERATRTQIRH